MASLVNKIESIVVEQKANPRFRFRLMMLLFRFYNLYQARAWKFIVFPIGIIYKFYTLIFLSIDIPLKTRIGNSLVIHHGFGIVIHRNAVLGNNVVLRHGVTIGQRFTDDGVPEIGNFVELGALSILLGPIVISDYVVVPALSITKNSIRPQRTQTEP